MVIMPESLRRAFAAALCAAVLCWGPATHAANATPTPAETVKAVVDALLDAVSGCRFLLATDPASLRELADARIRPAVDVLFAGQVILGKWWPEASATERRAFAENLYGSLANRYASSLILMSSGTVTVREASAATATDAVVPIVVRVPGYPPVTVALQLRRAADRWRVYDGRVEDLSTLLQLREQFRQEIGAKGLERVLARLEAEAAQRRPASPGTRRCLEGASGP